MANPSAPKATPCAGPLAKEGKGKEAMEMQRHQPDAIQRVKALEKEGRLI